MPVDIARQKGFSDIVNALLEEEVCNAVSISIWHNYINRFFFKSWVVCAVFYLFNPVVKQTQQFVDAMQDCQNNEQIAKVASSLVWSILFLLL